MKNEDGRTISEATEVKQRWKEYTENLYKQNSNMTETYDVKDCKDMVPQRKKKVNLTGCGRRLDGSGHLGLCKERVGVGIVGNVGG